jgi:hypothetical protein
MFCVYPQNESIIRYKTFRTYTLFICIDVFVSLIQNFDLLYGSWDPKLLNVCEFLVIY